MFPIYKYSSTAFAAFLTAALLLSPAQAFVAPSVPSPKAASTAGSPTQRFSSISIDPPSTSISDRVHQLLEQKKQEQKEEASKKSAAAKAQALPNVYHANSKEECMEIADKLLNRVTVFKFYATYCRACKKVEPRFDRLARENPDVDFVFVAVSASNKKFVVSDLGIPALPYGGIFHPEVGMVETMSVTAPRFSDFEEIVASYRDAECQLPELMEDSEGGESLVYAAPYERVNSSTKR